MFQWFDYDDDLVYKKSQKKNQEKKNGGQLKLFKGKWKISHKKMLK